YAADDDGRPTERVQVEPCTLEVGHQRACELKRCRRQLNGLWEQELLRKAPARFQGRKCSFVDDPFVGGALVNDQQCSSEVNYQVLVANSADVLITFVPVQRRRLTGWWR